MSLLTNASPWQNTPTKQKPAMLRTYQNIIKSTETPYQNSSGTPFVSDAANSENQQRVQRIETILQKMGSEQDSSELANYEPIPAPMLSDLAVEKSPEHPNLVPLFPHESFSTLPNAYREKPLVPDVKWIEKINYIIHLLEQQQLESTQYVWEEFLLYGLLGVFMIYLVDSFARVGKYIR